MSAGPAYPAQLTATRTRLPDDGGDAILSIANIKSWIGVAVDDHDAILDILRGAAIIELEKYTNLYLIPSAVVADYCPQYKEQDLFLTESPARTPTEVSVDGTALSSQPSLRRDGVAAYVTAPSDGWEGNEVKVTYMAGVDFATDSNADLIQQVLLLLIAGSYENRESGGHRPYQPNAALQKSIRALYIPKLYRHALGA